MKPLSLKWRVSIAIAAALFAVVVAVCALAYNEMQELLSDQVDRDLASSATAAAAVIDDPVVTAEETAELRGITGASEQPFSPFYRVWLPGSAEYFYAGGLSDKETALRDLVAKRQAPTPGGRVCFDFEIAGVPYRVIWAKAQTPLGMVNILVGQPVSENQRELKELLGKVVALGSAVTIPSIALALMLVTWGLRPIRATAAQLLNVTAANVGAVRLDATSAPVELRPFVDSVGGMLRRLNDALERQKAFVSDASHELKTPVALAKSTVQLALSRDRTPEEYKRALDAVQEDLRRAEHLIEELLTLAHIEDGANAPNKSLVDLEALLNRLAEVYSRSASDTGGRIVLSLGSASVLGNEDQLSRLFANLIDNAVKHGPKGGTTTISVEYQEVDRVSVVIKDEGGNIPADVLPRLFDRFYRADPSRARPTGGAGLGLAIAREIALRHGGEISITSDSRTGTCARVRLPLGAAQG